MQHLCSNLASAKEVSLMTREMRVYINSRTHEGQRGFAMACGHIDMWFPTLAQAKTQAEKTFSVKKWTRNGPGEYEGIGSDAIIEAESAEQLANSFGKDDTKDSQIYQMMLATVGTG
jgi:hypothetical protein